MDEKMDYRALIRTNVPVRFVRAIFERFPIAYRRSAEIANAEFTANQSVHCGFIRWGKCDDALFDAALSSGIPAERQCAANGQVHTEVSAGNVLIIHKKVSEPGEAGSAKYRQKLVKNNSQLELFTDVSASDFAADTGKPVLIELTHGPLKNDRSKIGFLMFHISDENGDKIDCYSLSSLYPDDLHGDSGIEVVPDLPPILPKRDTKAL